MSRAATSLQTGTSPVRQHTLVIWRTTLGSLDHLAVREYVTAVTAPRSATTPISDTLFELAPDAILVVDHDGRLLHINAQAERVFGYARGEVLGQPIEIFIPERLRAAHVGHRRRFATQPRTRDMGLGMELVGRRKDGSEFPVAVALAAVALGGSSGVIAIARDVTAQKSTERALRESERRLAAILDNTEALVSLRGRDGRYQFINRRYAELVGADRSALAGQTVMALWPPDLAAVAEAHDAAVIADGRAQQFEEVVPHSDGPHTYVSVKFPLVDADGEAYAVCTVATDITDRKRAEQSLQRAHDQMEGRVAERTRELSDANQRLREEQEKLIRAEKLSSLGVLASGVAHEINNPLSGVVGLVKSLRDGTVAESRREQYFSTILDGLERMRLTVQGMLDYARQRPPSRGAFDAREMVESCLRLVAPATHKKNLDVDLLVPPGRQLVADRGQLMQAVVNVVMNAVYVAPASSSIQVALVEDDGRVGLRVTDHGPGISETDLARLCDPFYTTKPEGEGTGLGLAITQNILVAHGGGLAIDSRLAHGTSVTLWLAD
jgi:two-component system NtrC family sensor kinase